MTNWKTIAGKCQLEAFRLDLRIKELEEAARAVACASPEDQIPGAFDLDGVMVHKAALERLRAMLETVDAEA